MRSNINLSRIARAASCCGLTEIICTGPAKLERNIARDGADTIRIVTHRTLPPVLKGLKQNGVRLVGLEQTTDSVDMHHYKFHRDTALVIGNERTGLTDDILETAGRRGRDPRVGIALQLQRRDRYGDGALRVL